MGKERRFGVLTYGDLAAVVALCVGVWDPFADAKVHVFGGTFMCDADGVAELDAWDGEGEGCNCS